MNVWELPTSLEIGGVGFAIRSDFRAVLDVLKAFNDPDLEDDEKAIVCLKILYEDFDKIPQEKYEEAFQKAVEFIDAGSTSDDSPKPRLMGAGRAYTHPCRKQGSRHRMPCSTVSALVDFPRSIYGDRRGAFLQCDKHPEQEGKGRKARKV